MAYKVYMQPYMFRLLLSYVWNDFKVIQYKQLAYQDDVSREMAMLLSQIFNLHFNCLYAFIRFLMSCRFFLIIIAHVWTECQDDVSRKRKHLS